MTVEQLFKFIRNEIHTTVFATTDEKHLPVTCVIDIMLAKGEKLFFLTAKGKHFYDRLQRKPYVSLTGIKGEDTMSSQSVTVRGKVKDIGSEMLMELFDANPYMYAIYPSVESRKALTVFEIYEGEGEYFDLSKKPIERFSFTFGGVSTWKAFPYTINDQCIGCGDCAKICPTQCIEKGTIYRIKQDHCLHCGNCFEVCQHHAVTKA